jgi:hypothetical protein
LHSATFCQDLVNIFRAPATETVSIVSNLPGAMLLIDSERFWLTVVDPGEIDHLTAVPISDKAAEKIRKWSVMTWRNLYDVRNVVICAAIRL